MPSLASTLQDRVEQMRGALRYGNPEVLSLVRLIEPHVSPLLGLKVEHLRGNRVPMEVAHRSPRISYRFLELFLHMNNGGWIPLDYRYANIMVLPDDELRIYDVRLMRAAALRDLMKAQPTLFAFRMLQLAHSIVDVERATQDNSSKLMARCREYISRLRGNFSESKKYESQVHKQFESIRLAKTKMDLVP
jgi:hypothetical protein